MDIYSVINILVFHLQRYFSLLTGQAILDCFGPSLSHWTPLPFSVSEELHKTKPHTVYKFYPQKPPSPNHFSLTTLFICWTINTQKVGRQSCWPLTEEQMTKEFSNQEALKLAITIKDECASTRKVHLSSMQSWLLSSPKRWMRFLMPLSSLTVEIYSHGGKQLVLKTKTVNRFYLLNLFNYH